MCGNTGKDQRLSGGKRKHLGPKGSTRILGESTKGSYLSQLMLLVLLTSGAAQSLQAGKLSCNETLSLLWHSFTHSPQPSLDSLKKQSLVFLSIYRGEASGLDGLSHMGAEEGSAPVQVLGL